ncbi:MAG: hypothetical protein J2P20_15875, partial [Pseudonocardia sp.]|nr:hypothetical protein [Pseudonocardia sp.]
MAAVEPVTKPDPTVDGAAAPARRTRRTSATGTKTATRSRGTSKTASAKSGATKKKGAKTAPADEAVLADGEDLDLDEASPDVDDLTDVDTDVALDDEEDVEASEDA